MAYNPFDDVIENDPAYMSNGGRLQVDLLTDKGFQDFFKVGREYLKSQGKDPFGGNYSVADIEEIGRNIANAQAGQKNVMAQQPAQEAPTKVPVPQFISEGEQIRNKQEKLQKLQDLYGQSAFTQSMQPVYQQRQQEDFSDVQQTIGAGAAPILETISMSETADRGKAKKEKNEQIKQQLGFGNQLLSKSQMDEAKQYGYEPLTIGETFAAIPDFMYGNQAESFRKLADGEQLEDEDKYNIITSPLDALDFLGVGIASGAVFKLLKRLNTKIN